MTYDLYIFDLDGTLIDSAGDIADALNGALAEHGLPGHPDAAVIAMIGDGALDLVRRALPADAGGLLAPVHAAFLDRYRAVSCRRTVPRPGAAATLAALPGLKAIATNKPGDLSRSIVTALGLDGHFFAVLGEDDVGRRKPDPLVVDRLRASAGVARDRTLLVGDSLVDAATAAAAGVDLALVAGGYADAAAIAAAPARWHLAALADLLEAG